MFESLPSPTLRPAAGRPASSPIDVAIVSIVTSATERQRDRADFLLSLYELTDADTLQDVNFRTIGARLGFDEQYASTVASYLADRGLAEWTVRGGQMGITTDGIDEAERLQEGGAQPPLAVLVLSPEEQHAVEAFLTAYRQSEDDLPIAGEDRAELDADVATLTAQMRSPRPKRRIVRAAVGEVHRVLSGAAGSAAYDGIVKLVEVLG